MQDSEEDVKESSASKYKTRSKQLNLDENLEVLEGKRKRAKVDYRESKKEPKLAKCTSDNDDEEEEQEDVYQPMGKSKSLIKSEKKQ